MVAINAALRVLGFLELPEDKVPPENLWHSNERLDEWFAAVKQREKDRAKGIESIESIDDGEEDYADPEVSNLRQV